MIYCILIYLLRFFFLHFCFIQSGIISVSLQSFLEACVSLDWKMLHLAFSARAGTSAATQQMDSVHLLAKSKKGNRAEEFQC